MNDLTVHVACSPAIADRIFGWNEFFRINILQIPIERFTLQFLSQDTPMRYITNVRMVLFVNQSWKKENESISKLFGKYGMNTMSEVDCCAHLEIRSI